MVRKILLALLGVCIVLGIWYHELIGYGWMQARGQFRILWNTRPVEEVLADASFPDSLKRKIELIQEIKRYAVDSLGINPSKNYTTFYDQHGQPILWVVVASEKYRLNAKEWEFPVIGTFAYKGFFERDRASQELDALKQLGYDTRLNEVSAWSTLGFFRDPILSSMLKRSEGQLAELIIHELTHGTLFVKDNLEYNENLADFVGEYGALKFLTQKYGAKSPAAVEYLDSKQYGEKYDEHILRGTQKLDSLYATYNPQTPQRVKEQSKWQLIDRIVETVDTLETRAVTDPPVAKKRRFNQQNLPNNAYFVAYKTYRQQQNSFRREFEEKFNSNFNQYLTYLKKTYPSL
ncbi:aminopeptidase [Larkinella terrae]|uniref:Aminopeptidase n=1 Tax=Larkinella terrae TaxID=2025311 RepID=A0A7K0ESX0_9BACT|nr:aminopeptidase [Larkinella terrae]MRS64508.1 aminopeptidase [Larkinella terrae]